MLNTIDANKIQNQLPANTQAFWDKYPDNAFSFEGAPLEDYINMALTAFDCEFIKSDKYKAEGRDGFVIISVTTPDQSSIRLQTGAIQMVRFGKVLIDHFTNNPHSTVPFVAIPHETAKGTTYYPISVSKWLDDQELAEAETVQSTAKPSKRSNK